MLGPNVKLASPLSTPKEHRPTASTGSKSVWSFPNKASKIRFISRRKHMGAGSADTIVFSECTVFSSSSVFHVDTAVFAGNSFCVAFCVGSTRDPAHSKSF